MKIHLTRSGGFAGIPKNSDVDSRRLPPEMAKELESLVLAANLSAKRAPNTIPDAYQYDLTVEEAGAAHHLTFGEAALDPHARKLIDWVTSHAQPH